MNARLIGGTVLVALGLLVGGLVWWGRNPPPGPTVGIRFVGLAGGGIHSNSFGLFEVTNPGPTRAEFSLSVEAPNDPLLMMSQAFQSTLGFGAMDPGEARRMDALVASAPGIPFRPVLVYADPPSPLVRVWLRLVRIESRLLRLWSPSPVRIRTQYGDWTHFTTNTPVIHRGVK